MLLAGGARPAVIRRLGTAPPVCFFSITAQSMGNKDKNGTMTELLLDLTLAFGIIFQLSNNLLQTSPQLLLKKQHKLCLG